MMTSNNVSHFASRDSNPVFQVVLLALLLALSSTNSFAQDTDSDGVDDAIEIAYGTDHLDPLENPIQSKLTASDAHSSAQFGTGVSVSGDDFLGTHTDKNSVSHCAFSACCLVDASAVWRSG